MRSLLGLLGLTLFIAACDSNTCEADFSDVVITETSVGEGLTAMSYDAPTIAFQGYLEDGTQVFNDTITFALDNAEVREGINDGVRGMKVGGTRHVIVPSGLAFGCQETDEIPANSTLEFDFELLSLDRVQITELQAGTGETADANDLAVVTYQGRLTNGSIFDAGQFSYRVDEQDRSRTMPIPGFNAGVRGMKVGGKRQVTIPPSLGYGAQGSGGVIPPNSTLIFEITLNTLTKG